jgi:polyphosphate kinase 2
MSKKPNNDTQQLSDKEYAKQLRSLQIELCYLQRWVEKTQARVMIVFEGRDGAGKGGIIKAIKERVSPRVFKVVALSAPSDREKSQLFMQRYIPHFPAGGEVVIFDRSWYNRAGIEHVMKFCSDEEHQDFLRLCPIVEDWVTKAGVILIKLWLEIGMAEQTRRIEARVHDPLRQWKLSPMDVESYNRWYQYSRARDQMLAATDRDLCPWYILHSENKKRARLNGIAHILSLIPFERIDQPLVNLPKRGSKGKYDDQAGLKDRRIVPARY